MAIKNNITNEYLKINGIDFSTQLIKVSIYMNQEHRLSGDNEYLMHCVKYIDITDLNILQSSTINQESINDKIISLCYELLKSKEEYNQWVDC